MPLTRSPVRRPVNLPSEASEAQIMEPLPPQESTSPSTPQSSNFLPSWRSIVDNSSNSSHQSTVSSLPLSKTFIASGPTATMPLHSQQSANVSEASISEQIQTLAMDIVGTLRQSKSVTAEMRNRAVDTAHQIVLVANRSLSRRAEESEADIVEHRQEIASVRQELSDIKELVTNALTAPPNNLSQPEFLVTRDPQIPSSILDAIMDEIRELRKELTERNAYCAASHVTRSELHEILRDNMEPFSKELKTVTTTMLELKEAKHDEVIALMNEQGSALATDLALAEVRTQLNQIQTQVNNNTEMARQAANYKDKEPTKQPPLEAPNPDDRLHSAQTQKERNQRPRSYAEITAKPNFAVLLESADPRKTSEDVIKQVKQSVNVIELGIGVNRITKIKNQKVIMSCSSQEERKALQNAIREKCTQVSAKSAKDRLPQVKLLGVINDLTNDQVEKALINQNKRLLSSVQTDSTVKVVRRTKGRTQETNNIILEVSPIVWNAVKGQKLHIGLQSVQAVDQSPIVQCYKCMGYNHKAADCKDQVKCGYCAKNHDTRECRSRDSLPRCCNCTLAKRQDTAHPSYSQECPDWQKWDGIARSAERIKIVQVNLGRGYAATQECLSEATDQGYSIMLLQEPYVGSKGFLALGTKHRIYQHPTVNSTQPVRSAIVVLNPNLRIIESSQWTTRDIVAIKLKTDTATITIISVYLDKTYNIEQSITSLQTIINATDSTNLVIAGDVNAKSPWWGCDTEDVRGSVLVDVIFGLGMEVLNEGSQPTFSVFRQGQHCRSIIDITACSAHILNQLTDWQIKPNLCSLTDHIPISFTITTHKLNCPESSISSTRMYHTVNADWTIFEEILKDTLASQNINSHSIQNISNTKDLESTVEKYQEAITNACSGAIPKVEKSTMKAKSKWWTKELSKLKAEVKRIRNKIKKANAHRKDIIIKEYLEKKTEYKKAIEEAITKSWKKFCTTEEKETVWERTYRILKYSGKTIRENLLISDDGNTLTSDESAILMANTFFPEDDPSNDTDEQIDTRQRIDKLRGKELPLNRNIMLFTKEELHSSLKSMKAKKAPGIDGFTADICRKAYDSDPDTLLAIYNQCLLFSYFPEVWKKAFIRIIPKPGKSEYNHPKAFRPIGLLPLLGKILEKMVAKRLQWDLITNSSLHTNQYGFIPQRSTEDALTDALSLIEEALTNKRMAVMVSLDIQGAFDSAWWPAIVTQLEEKNIDTDILHLIASYLSDRKIVLSYSGSILTRTTNRGCIQGSICGPTLWNVQLDQVLESTQYPHVRIQAFADDILLIAQGDTGEEIEGNLNSALTKLVAWGKKLKLQFAPQKTQAVLFTRKIKYNTPKLVMDGIHIRLQKELKVLGLTIDQNLNFRKHLSNVTKKALNIYKSVSRMARAQWGLNSDILKLIYRTVVEPTILYAASCWAQTTNKRSTCSLLDRVTRLFAIKIIKGHRTTSFTASVTLAGILPLKYRAIELAELYQIKKGKPLESLPGREFETRTPLAALPHPSSRSKIEFTIINNQDEINEIIDNTLPQIYTDGSKIQDRVGGSASSWFNGKEVWSTTFRLEDFCSVYQAELMAILKALEYMNKKRDHIQANILSDSKSALQSIADPCSLHPLTIEIRNRIKNLMERGGKVYFYWVKAHVGIQGNERADDLAKTAALKKRAKPAYDRFPLSLVKRELRERSVEAWQTEYSNSSTGSNTKIFLPDVRKAYKILQKTKFDSVTTHLLTGHGGNRSYLHKYKLIDSPACKCDDETPQTIIHIITECPRFAKIRYNCECLINSKITENNLEHIFHDDETRPFS
ncbi:uncharacterized protein LOC128200104 [Galleria mellonella]|uniref:Uncharacterized protein LOC128200104 n=1 Tax=Galleria mellonella TaxID=7137 RepID=A0ABM3MA13_GALME|nr:uncharacterized protein LOC128200104 [Galleria mellonella]